MNNIIEKLVFFLHCLSICMGTFEQGPWTPRANDQRHDTTMERSNSDVEPPFITARVPMRDGVEVVVDIFINSSLEKYPAILEVTPYGRKLNKPNFRNEAAYWMSYGYAFIIADARGTGESGGDFRFLYYEGKDGYDLVEWIARQSWCNGRVSMRGASYSGENQWYTAREKPPNLFCITPSATPDGPMREVPYDYGAFALNWALNWVGSSLNIAYPPAVNPHPDPKSWLNYRPLRTLDVYAIGHALPLYQTFLDHPTYDDYWRAIGFQDDDFSKISIPTLAFTGWFDSTLTGTIKHYQGISKYSPLKDEHFLIVGPYSHGTAVDGGYNYLNDLPVPTVGEIVVPENGLLPARNMTRQFYDWCLKNGSRPDWNAIRLFIIGSNTWIEPKRFPPEQARQQSLYLSSDGHANGVNGNGRLQWMTPTQQNADYYTYDPMNPVMVELSNNSYEFPVDISAILERNDVLVYTTNYLTESLTVVGEVSVELLFSSTATDTDVVVQLMDVMPDGRSIKLGAGFSSQLRLRYRDGFNSENLMVPGTNYSITVTLNEIGHTFLVGHRIRLAITSSFYPWLSANPNTGRPIDNDTQTPIIANQTIFYGGETASRIRLTLIDLPHNIAVSDLETSHIIQYLFELHLLTIFLSLVKC